MDEETSIINSNTRNEKIKNFIREKKGLLISFISMIIILLIGYFIIIEFNEKKKIEISNLYNSTVIQYSINSKEDIVDDLIDIINKKDSTYSPLSLYFIIDNSLIKDLTKVNKLFDIIINEVSLDEETQNLIHYKKVLYPRVNREEFQDPYY